MLSAYSSEAYGLEQDICNGIMLLSHSDDVSLHFCYDRIRGFDDGEIALPTAERILKILRKDRMI
ncbi:MAG: hypothetical protein CVU64_23770 [Deltaproteobacteria bacterium HGW-Deltaproteobacteria-21]|nr:MAG: hypothetical protein CVU64_23770 [Deltaproteobacteria bacterium HGW-Deltaproteobacteria-21]